MTLPDGASFPDWPWNRRTHPDRHVVVCEDYLDQQVRIASRFRDTHDPQGRVQFSFVPGGLPAAAIMFVQRVDLVVLDHDMPNGNGRDLIHWMASTGRQTSLSSPSPGFRRTISG